MEPVVTMESGAHVALLDPVNGAGVLVVPNVRTDVRMSSGESLHEADWNSVVRRLVRDGWSFLVDEWDLPIVVARLSDGRAVHGMYPGLVNEWTEPPTAADDREYAKALWRLLDGFAMSGRTGGR